MHRSITAGEPRRRAARKLFFELLESRFLLTSSWHNPWLDGDVNADGLVAPLDALFVINRINNREQLGEPPSGPHPFYDTSDNGTLEPRDVLIVINIINFDVTPPVVTLALRRDTGPGGSTDGDRLTADPTIQGSLVDRSGIRVAHANVDEGPGVPISLAPDGTFTFTPGLALDGSDDGEHTLRVTAVDARGKQTTESLTFVLAADPTGISRVTPEDGETLVNVARETKVYFDEAIVPDTVTSDSLFLIANGQRVPGRVVVSSTERFATYYYESALPSSTQVRVVVDGDSILGRDGFPIDADGDGHPGGRATSEFRTLSLTRIPATNVFGFVRDSFAETPIVGATIRVDAFPEASAVTDETGRFELRDMPAPDFFVHIDGSTATNAPAGFTYPNVGKPFHSVPGRTVQLNSGGTPFDIFLPPMAVGDIQDLSSSQTTPIGFGPDGKAKLQEMFPELDAGVWDALRVDFAPGSAVGDDGTPATQAVVIPVPPDRIPAPLPSHMHPQLVVSIQAPGATTFDVPAPITFPNLDGLAPGKQAAIYSFNHDAGRFQVIGAGTVSEDGTSIVSDPGVGVPAPGWHFTDPSSCGSGDGPVPGRRGGEASRGSFGTGAAGEGEGGDTQVIYLTAGTSGTLFDLTWESDPGDAEACVAEDETPAEPEGTTIHVKIDIDGPLASFLNSTGTETLSEGTREFTLAVGASQTRSFKAQAKTYAQLFPTGLDDVTNDRLYGGKVTVTEQRLEPDGSSETRVRSFLIYRWVNVSSAEVSGGVARLRSAPDIGLAEFERTIENARRTKTVEYFLPRGLTTKLSEAAEAGNFDLAKDDLVSSGEFTWEYANQGENTATAVVQITADQRVIGDVLVEATGAKPTTVSVNKQGFQDEFLRVTNWLVNARHPGADRCPGTCGVDTNGDMIPDLDTDGDGILDGDDDGDGTVDNLQEYGANGSDDAFVLLYDRSWRDDNADGIPDVIPNTFVRQVTLAATGQLAEVLDPANVTIDPDGVPESGDEYRAFVQPSARFRNQILNGLLPTDKTDPGPDGVLGTRDDRFSAAKQGQLETLASTTAQQVVQAVAADFSFDPTLEQQHAIDVVPDNAGDVTMVWMDTEGFFGSADFDARTEHLRSVLSSNALPLAAKRVELTKSLNPNVVNDGGFAVSMHMEWDSAGATFAEYVANTVSHELGHTFGLKDAYISNRVSPWPPAGTAPFGTARCLADRNCVPYDLMRIGMATDGDLSFDARNQLLLLASLGAHADDHPKWNDAVQLYRDAFHLPDDGPTPHVGIREANFDGPFFPVVAVSRGNDVFFGHSDETGAFMGRAIADGAGGSLLSAEFEIQNRGTAPLVIESIELADGGVGFQLAGLPDPTPVQPGASVSLTIVFDPETAGRSTDTLRIQSNAVLPEIQVALTADGLSRHPVAELVRRGNNNLGAVLVNGGTSSDRALYRLENRGGTTLTINQIVAADGAEAFQVLGWTGSSLDIAPGASWEFGLAYDATEPGLERGLFYLETNDPLRPSIRFSAVGTGLPDSGRLEPAVGHDYVYVRADVDGSDAVIRQRSNGRGRFDTSVPGDAQFETLIYDPESTLIARDFGVTAEAGARTHLTLGTRFHPSSTEDSDYDGLPDDVELAIGTGPLLFDTDQDMVDDYSELRLGLDPLSLGNYPTGVIASLPLLGRAEDIEIVDRLAYVATAEHGMAIVDISAAENPIVLGQVDLPGNNFRIAVDPRRAIAALTAGSSVNLVDIADPMLPVPLGGIQTSALSIAAYDGLVFVGTTAGQIQAYDLASRELVQSLAIPGGGPIRELVREGTILYAYAGVATALVTIDITQFGLAERLGSGVVPSDFQRMAVGNGLAVIASNDVRTASVAELSAPRPLSGGGTRVGAQSVALNGSGLALVGSSLGLQVFDVADPLERPFLFLVPVSGQAVLDVGVGAGIAYVGTPAGLQVVNYLGIDADGQPPQASLRTPLADADPGTDGYQVIEGRTLPIQAVAMDDVQVRDVELLVDGEVVARDSSFPFDFSVVALSESSGSLQIQLRARDTGGNVGLSELLTVELIADNDVPQIAGLTPADQAQVPQEEGADRIAIRFSEPMAESVLDAVTLRTTSGQAVAPRARQLRGDSRFLELRYDRFAPGVYEIVVNGTATDRAGNAIGGADIVTSFTIVPDTIAPRLNSTHPSDGQRFVLADQLEAVTLNFSERMDRDTISASTVRLLDGQDQPVPLSSIEFPDLGQRAVLHYGLLPADSYRLVIQADQVTDLAGNALGAEAISTAFQVLTELIPPTVSAVFPGHGTALPVGLTSASVLFSEPIRAGDLTPGNFTLRRRDGTPVPIHQLDARNGDQLAVLRFDPLPQGRYELEIDEPRIRDLAGNVLQAVEVTEFLLGTPQSARDFYHDRRYDLAGQTLTLADLNQDGQPDLVSGESSEIQVRLGDGTGRFGGPLVFRFPQTMAIRDAKALFINDDNILDLAVGSGSAAAGLDFFATLLGVGDGTFVLGEVVPSTIQISQLELADVNRDGRMDVLAASDFCRLLPCNDFDGRVELYVRNEDATFQMSSIFSGFRSRDFAIGDLDGDGDPDVVTAPGNSGQSRTDAHLTVLENGVDDQGELQFQRVQAYASGIEYSDLVLADFNEDGHFDVIGGNGQTAFFWAGTGTLEFAAPVQLANVAGTNGLVAMDFDEDGKQDLGYTPGRDFVVILGNGDGTFGSERRFPVSSGAGAMLLADVNSDQRSDLVGRRDPSLVLLGLEGLDFEVPGPEYPSGFDRPSELGGPHALVEGDFDGDGDLDLAVVNEGYARYQRAFASILLTNEQGHLVPSARVDLGDVSPSAVTAGDFDGDGDLDLAVTDSGERGYYGQFADNSLVLVLRGNGDGSFGSPDSYEVGLGSEDLIAGDLDGDGDLDLITANTGQPNYSSSPGSLSILIGDGDGAFQPASTIVDSQKPWSLVLADFNGDTRLDVLTAGSASGDARGLTFHAHDGQGGFLAGVPIPTSNQVRRIAAADFNEDDRVDVVAVGASATHVLLGNGDGSFTSSTVASGSKEHVDVGDVDGDQNLDLAIGGTRGAVDILLGRGDGTFSDGGSFASVPYGLVLADVNGDNRDDLVSLLQSGRVALRLHTGFPEGSPLLAADAAGGAGAPVPTAGGSDLLTQGQLREAAKLAIQQWTQLGVDASSFNDVEFRVADLPGRYLGLAQGNRITMDRDAAGYGWYVAPDAPPGGESPWVGSRRMHLLTAMTHELGHVLGLPDLYEHEDGERLMFDWLTVGTRRGPSLDDLDAIMADAGELEWLRHAGGCEW